MHPTRRSAPLTDHPDGGGQFDVTGGILPEACQNTQITCPGQQMEHGPTATAQSAASGHLYAFDVPPNRVCHAAVTRR
jgi:hypothetical protein